MKDLHINRRQFFALSASTFGAVYLSQCAFGQSTSPPLKSKNTARKQKTGLAEIFLTARYGVVNLAGRQAYLFNYNGQVPGPRIEVRAGDTVRVHLTNTLEQLTNLHYHGLHVSPSGNADNFFLEIPPGETFTYEFTLPKNHPAGTFWYHPHIHGLTAEQIFGGLAGLLVVRGKIDEIPEIRAAKEDFLVLQDFALDSDGQMLAPNPMSQMMAGREGSLVTVNGEVNPSLSIPSGGLLRLRFLNASASRFYRLVLEDHPLYQIATDSGALAEPVEQKELLLVPGERAEVLIKGDRGTGQYRLLNLPYDRGGMGMMDGMGMMGGRGMMGGGRMRGQQPITQETGTLATLTYQGTVQPLPLPTQLLPIEALPPPQIVRQFTLNAAHMTFTINGKTFDHDRVDTRVSLNTIEDWEIANPDTMMSMDHPFHIHTNSFQVISRNGVPEPYLAWRDMVLVRPGEVVRIRIPFRDFSGKTIYHCHISDHGDRGMMGVIVMED
jgi:FtsP/CotA-like multicopper oxidase with cupredoxin domain